MFKCCECGGDKYNQKSVLLDYGAKLCCEECWEEVIKRSLSALGLTPGRLAAAADYTDHAVLLQVFNQHVKPLAMYKDIDDWCSYFHKTEQEMIEWIKKDHSAHWSKEYYVVTGKHWGTAP